MVTWRFEGACDRHLELGQFLAVPERTTSLARLEPEVQRPEPQVSPRPVLPEQEGPQPPEAAQTD